MQQSPNNPPPQQYSRGMQYFIGIVIGVVPLVLSLFSLASHANFSNTLLSIAVIGYLAVLVASIVCLCLPRVRFVGYGLLTLVLASPVIFFIACTVVVSRTV